MLNMPRATFCKNNQVLHCILFIFDRSGCPDCDDDNVENPYGNDQPQDRSGLFRSFPSNGGDDDNHHFSFHFSESDDMMKHFDEMFRSFDEVFKSMGIADFSPQGKFYLGYVQRQLRSSVQKLMNFFSLKLSLKG